MNLTRRDVGALRDASRREVDSVLGPKGPKEPVADLGDARRLLLGLGAAGLGGFMSQRLKDTTKVPPGVVLGVAGAALSLFGAFGTWSKDALYASAGLAGGSVAVWGAGLGAVKAEKNEFAPAPQAPQVQIAPPPTAPAVPAHASGALGGVGVLKEDAYRQAFAPRRAA